MKSWKSWKKQNTDFVHFLCTNILNWPLHGKKKHCWALQIQMQTLHATIRGSNWQRPDPMAYRHRQNDSSLAQWCWGIQWGWQSYFRVFVPLLITTLYSNTTNVVAVRALIGAPPAGGALGDRLACLCLETVLIYPLQ